MRVGTDPVDAVNDHPTTADLKRKNGIIAYKQNVSIETMTGKSSHHYLNMVNRHSRSGKWVLLPVVLLLLSVGLPFLSILPIELIS